MGFVNTWLFLVGHWEVVAAIAAIITVLVLGETVFPALSGVVQFLFKYWYFIPIGLMLLMIHGLDMEISASKLILLKAQNDLAIANKTVAEALAARDSAISANAENTKTIENLKAAAQDNSDSLAKELSDKDDQIALITSTCGNNTQTTGPGQHGGFSRLRDYERKSLGHH